MPGITAAEYSGVLKTYYTKKKLVNQTFDAKARKLLTVVLGPKRWESVEGAVAAHSIMYRNAGTSSADFAVAQELAASSAFAQIQLPMREGYRVGQIPNKLVLQSRTDMGGFLKGANHIVDSTLEGQRNRLEYQLFRTASGEIGTIGSISSNVITLANIKEANQFGKGQHLVFAASLTGALRDSGNAGEVTAVDRVLGKITLASTPTGTVAGDLIWLKGDRTAGATPTYANPDGLASHIPATEPASNDSFYGVNRSVDPVGLAGHRFTGISGDPKGSIYDASAQMAQISNSAPDVAIVSNEMWKIMTQDADVQIVRDQNDDTAKFGYKRIEFEGHMGTIDVMASAFCQQKTIWLLKRDTWILYHLDAAPVNILDEDGMKVRYSHNKDALEVRVGQYVNLGCFDPGQNGRIDFS